MKESIWFGLLKTEIKGDHCWSPTVAWEKKGTAFLGQKKGNYKEFQISEV